MTTGKATKKAGGNRIGRTGQSFPGDAATLPILPKQDRESQNIRSRRRQRPATRFQGGRTLDVRAGGSGGFLS